MTREAYDASFANLVSLVANRDSRRSENQKIIRDLFRWFSFFFLDKLCSSVIGCFGGVWERFWNSHRQVITSAPRL